MNWMKTMFSQILCLGCLMFIHLTALSKTTIWEVKKGNSTVYLGGTIHVLSQKDYPLPQAFDEVYQASQIVVLEADMAEMNAPETMAFLQQEGRFEQGKSLKTELKPSTYDELKKYLQKRNLTIETFELTKPSIMILTLLMYELRAIGVDTEGVDAHYYGKALKDKKPMLSLESVKHQLELMLDIGDKEPDEFILYSLKDFSNIAEVYRQLIDAWKKGDLEKLEILALEPLIKESDWIYQELLVKRNIKWMPKIEEMLRTNEKELVLVGALHLVGEDGLLQRLKNKGYSVRPYQ